MRKSALTILFFLILFGRPFAQAELRIMEGLAMPSRILNQDVKFSVCLPEDYYKSGRKYSVVYLLHGLGDEERDDEHGGDAHQHDAQLAQPLQQETSEE